MNIEVEGSVWCNTGGSSGEVNDGSSPKEVALLKSIYAWMCNFEYVLACGIIIWTKSQINAKSLNSENQLCTYPLIFIFTDLGWEKPSPNYIFPCFPPGMHLILLSTSSLNISGWVNFSKFRKILDFGGKSSNIIYKKS